MDLDPTNLVSDVDPELDADVDRWHASGQPRVPLLAQSRSSTPTWTCQSGTRAERSSPSSPYLASHPAGDAE
jgi:hypothetical protein